MSILRCERANCAVLRSWNCSGASEFSTNNGAKSIFPPSERTQPITTSLIQESSLKQKEKWNRLQILTPPDSPTMSRTTCDATLEYTGEVWVAGVEPERLLKTQNEPGTDNRTEAALVPVKDGAFDDEFAGLPLWSSTLSTDKALVPTGNESSNPLSLTLGTGLPLDISLCEAMDEPSLDTDFFEQFVDLNGPLGDVPDLDFSQLLATDICQPDMVAMMNSVQDASTFSQSELASPNDVLNFLSDADSTSIVPQLPSPTPCSNDEITVIQTSDTVPPSPESPVAAPSVSGLDNSQFGQAIDFTELFKVFDSPVLSTCGNMDITLPSVQEPVESGKRKSCEPPSPLPAKRVKKAHSVVSDSDSAESIPSPALDKSAERRRKNNVASKNARAARRERENNLFVQEKELEQSNAELRAQLEMLTKEAEMLRKVVVERLSRGNVA